MQQCAAVLVRERESVEEMFVRPEGAGRWSGGAGRINTAALLTSTHDTKHWDITPPRARWSILVVR